MQAGLCQPILKALPLWWHKTIGKQGNFHFFQTPINVSNKHGWHGGHGEKNQPGEYCGEVFCEPVPYHVLIQEYWIVFWEAWRCLNYISKQKLTHFEQDGAIHVFGFLLCWNVNNADRQYLNMRNMRKERNLQIKSTSCCKKVHKKTLLID